MDDSASYSKRTHVRLGKETVTQIAATDFPGHWPNEDNSWDLQDFRRRLQVKIGRRSHLAMELDMVGLDASIANAIRRVLMAEVPTVAVENVYIWNNTSIVQDEVLSQRLGLVPLKIDPRKVEYKQPGDEPTDLNTIVFSLVIKCDRHRNVSKSEKDPEKLYKNAHVYSSSFAWQGKGVQSETFQDDPPEPVFKDILLAKLRPGQEILLEMHCEKGIGKDHAKWSPVATASYRLMPSISFTKPIPSELCDKFAGCFAPGVIEVTQDASSGSKSVVVKEPRRDTVSREVLRHSEFEDSVVLSRKRDHFIFNIESVGQYPSEDLVPAALDILLAKVVTLRSALSA